MPFVSSSLAGRTCQMGQRRCHLGLGHSWGVPALLGWQGPLPDSARCPAGGTVASMMAELKHLLLLGWPLPQAPTGVQASLKPCSRLKALVFAGHPGQAWLAACVTPVPCILREDNSDHWHSCCLLSTHLCARPFNYVTASKLLRNPLG